LQCNNLFAPYFGLKRIASEPSETPWIQHLLL
jgi:hypothetical protein